jgi:hypothetical protein
VVPRKSTLDSEHNLGENQISGSTITKSPGGLKVLPKETFQTFGIIRQSSVTELGTQRILESPGTELGTQRILETPTTPLKNLPGKRRSKQSMKDLPIGMINSELISPRTSSMRSGNKIQNPGISSGGFRDNVDQRDLRNPMKSFHKISHGVDLLDLIEGDEGVDSTIVTKSLVCKPDRAYVENSASDI